MLLQPRDKANRHPQTAALKTNFLEIIQQKLYLHRGFEAP
jgi:hypothetical protein